MTVQPEREQDMATIRLTITLPEGEMETVRAIQETYGLETNSAAIWFALKTWQAAIAKGLMPKFLGKVPVAYLAAACGHPSGSYPDAALRVRVRQDVARPTHPA
jgi:hypothetical protein